MPSATVFEYMVLERVETRTENDVTVNVYELREAAGGPRIFRGFPTHFTPIVEMERFQKAQQAIGIDTRKPSVRISALNFCETDEGWYLEVRAQVRGEREAPDIVEL